MKNHEDEILILQRISILKNHIRGAEVEIESCEDKYRRHSIRYKLLLAKYSKI